MPRKKQKLDESQGRQAADNVKIATQQRTSRRVTRSTAHVPSPLPEVIPKKQSTASVNATSSHRNEEGGKERRVMGASLMTNVLALADTVGVKKGFYVDADQLLFLDTIRVLAVVPDISVVPAKEVYEKILSGIWETKSLRVTVASFRLLHDLDLRHPQVNLKSNGTGEKRVYEFVNNKEHVWSPFESATQKSEKSAKVTKDLYMLLGNIADDLEGEETSKKRGASDFIVRNEDPHDRLVQFLMLRWLVSLLYSDFQVRQQAFQENPEKLDLVQDSLIIRFLMRQDNSKIKELLKNLLRIIAKPGELDDLKGGNPKGLKTEVARDVSQSHGSEINATASVAPSVGSSPAFFVTETDFAHLAATLLSMILELEDIKALSDNNFGTSRNAISIGSLVETLMGILQYGKAYLCPLLLILKNPQLKFKLILKCFATHAPGKTKDELREISTAKKLFDCVSNVKALHKRFYPHELQVLLASAFQVFLETHSSDDAHLREVCRSFHAAFDNLDVTMDYSEMHHTARCALVMAHALINSYGGT